MPMDVCVKVQGYINGLARQQEWLRKAMEAGHPKKMVKVAELIRVNMVMLQAECQIHHDHIARHLLCPPAIELKGVTMPKDQEPA